MDDLREEIAEVIREICFGRDSVGNIGDVVGEDEAAAAILAIPEIATALAMKRTVDGIKAGRLDFTPPQA